MSRLLKIFLAIIALVLFFPTLVAYAETSICGTCDGKGYIEEWEWVDEGEVERHGHTYSDGYWETVERECPDCGGLGEIED